MPTSRPRLGTPRPITEILDAADRLRGPLTPAAIRHLQARSGDPPCFGTEERHLCHNEHCPWFGPCHHRRAQWQG